MNAVTLTFEVEPTGAGVILASGVDVTGSSIEVAQGTVLSLHVDAAEGHTLQNWNRGEWFDTDWAYEATESATVTALLD